MKSFTTQITEILHSNWIYLYSGDLFLNLNLDVGVIGQVVADSCREVQVYLARLLYVELLVMGAHC